MKRPPGAPPDESEEATSLLELPDVIELSDRRPTPKEVPAFALERVAAERAMEEDPRTLAYREAMAVFEEEPSELEARILERLVALAAPEVRRFPFATIRELLREARSLPEARLVEWEQRLGSRPARLLREPWLNERAFRFAGLHLRRDIIGAQQGDSGVILGSELFLLTDGRLVQVEPVGYWKLRARYATRSVTAIGHAQLIDCTQATASHPLRYMVEGLRSLLWYLPRGEPLAPPEPDLESRRDRFVALVRELTRATNEYKQQLRRVAFNRA